MRFLGVVQASDADRVLDDLNDQRDSPAGGGDRQIRADSRASAVLHAV
ncbi:hypothetical protein ACFXPA_37295 [Amycolatopsis sp. NPDC059090]